MAIALELAERGQYTVHPNPAVGCVIVRGNEIVGQGWHEVAGGSHAEVHALESAGERARGATLYVTLEPCNHTGRTAPCTEAVIRAGVSRVVVASEDPNPLVSSRGLARLNQAGIEVVSGVCARAAGRLNRGFFKRMNTKMPFVTLKTAASLDGRTAMPEGESQWITSELARRDGHRLRALSSAVLTGIGTVERDDPALTVRHVETTRQPDRIILDGNLSISSDARVFDGPGNVYLFTTSASPIPRELETKRGVEIIVCEDDNGRINLQEVLRECASREMNTILVEAGSRLGGSFMNSRLVDEVVVYMSPDLLGSDAAPLFDLPGISRLADRIEMQCVRTERLDPDIKLVLAPRKSEG